MTDQDEKRPLTRREMRLREMEATGAIPIVDERLASSEGGEDAPAPAFEIDIPLVDEDGRMRSRRELRELRAQAEAAAIATQGGAEPSGADSSGADFSRVESGGVDSNEAESEDTAEPLPETVAFDVILDQAQAEFESRAAEESSEPERSFDELLHAAEAAVAGDAEAADAEGDNGGSEDAEAEIEAEAEPTGSLSAGPEPTEDGAVAFEEAESEAEVAEAEVAESELAEGDVVEPAAAAGPPTDPLDAYLVSLGDDDRSETSRDEPDGDIDSMFAAFDDPGAGSAASTTAGEDDIFGSPFAPVPVSSDPFTTGPSVESLGDEVADGLKVVSDAEVDAAKQQYSFPDIAPLDEGRSVFDDPTIRMMNGSGARQGQSANVGGFDDLISRAVAQEGAAGTTNSSALILPNMPDTDGLAGPLGETGELYITGSIDLPKSLGETGGHSALHDSVEIEPLDELGFAEPTPTGAIMAPVSASRAVSARGAQGPLVAEATKDKSKMPIVLIATGGVLVLGATGLIIWAASSGLFG